MDLCVLDKGIPGSRMTKTIVNHSQFFGSEIKTPTMCHAQEENCYLNDGQILQRGKVLSKTRVS